MHESAKLLREREKDEQAGSQVRSVELFFDLVFVFAVTQLSHLLLVHLDLVGVLQTTILLMAVWWGWINTAWVTNWLDPDRTPVRLMLFVLMLTGLVMSAALPKAFDTRGLGFALAYVCMQLVRDGFMLWALKNTSPNNFLNFKRIATWHCASAVFWLAGAFVEPNARMVLWAIAVLIELIAPAVGFWVPVLGRSTTEDWNVSGDHMAERCGLFIIIALGESLLITGATFADLKWATDTFAAMASALIGSIAMWWIYFHIGAERARHIASKTVDPGRIARLAYTYVHILLVAGVIVSAVADELVLKHPNGHADPKLAWVSIGGPALFLFGNLLFKWCTAGWPPLSHMGGLAMLGVLALFSTAVSPLGLAMITCLVLVAVALWEAMSLGHFDAEHPDVSVDAIDK